jgi:metal-sulfur cluster biosynthetic enzyme
MSIQWTIDEVSAAKLESETISADAARDQAWETIRVVTDPELDESIAELGFIQSLTITEPPADSFTRNRFDVQLTFRLPTYWCAANFAFIMAEDLRERVAQLPWVNEVRVELADHYTADEINRGITTGKSFSESFPDEGGGDLKDLRRLFRLKAFQRRQYGLLRHLLDRSGDSPEVRAEILAMTITQLRDFPITDDEGTKLRGTYLNILPEFAPADAVTGGSASLAFILPNGEPLNPEGLDDHLRQLRRTTTNIEFNSAICSSLLKARNSDTATSKSGVLPTK